jgi:CelD/BcsL family acetyltransferase involved in cellulose biosynthesis
MARTEQSRIAGADQPELNHPGASESVPVYRINPLLDARWGKLVQEHAQASVFHTAPWLEALERTYGYEPVVYTASQPEHELRNGLVFCRVNSWLTGKRLVSLPFSDHCEPLLESVQQLPRLLAAAEQDLRREKLRYLEVRPLETAASEFGPGFHPAQSYCLHLLDLSGGEKALQGGFHTLTKRNIQRAEREGLRYEEGRSEKLLDAFIRLNLMTRRRHQIPPQPRKWFENLVALMGNALTIGVAYHGERPTAAIFTLTHKGTITYKYSCSDPEFHKSGGTSGLTWLCLKAAVQRGLLTFDFGRSAYENKGLVEYKDRWGSRRLDLSYGRLSASNRVRTSNAASSGWTASMRNKIISRLPDAVLSAAGDLVYRHIG